MADTPAFPTSPPSKVSKRSGTPRGSARAPTCSIAPRPPTRPRRRSTPSTLPRRPRPAACTSATCSRFTHTDLKARFQRMRGKTVFYPMGWDDNGLPTERRVQNYYGVRCDPSLPYDPDFAPPFEGGDNKSSQGRRPGADQPPQLHRAVRDASPSRTRSSSRSCSASSASSVDWTQTYRTIARRDDPHVAARVPAQPRARRGVPGAGARRCGTSTFRTADRPGRARGPRAAGRTTTASPSTGPTAGDVEIETTRPELLAGVRGARRAPRRRALPAAVRHDRDARPLFGVEVPVRRAPPRPAGQGLRHRDDLHLRRRDRRRVVARARPAQPHDHRPRRPGRRRGARTRSSTRGRHARPTPSSPARRCSARRSAWSSCCSESGDLIGEPKPITHPVKFYEKGDRPLEIVSTRQWYIAQRRPRRGAARHAARARHARSTWHPDFMRVRYENWVERPHRRLAHLPPAVLRRADPGLVPARRRTASATSTSRIVADARPAPRRPVIERRRPGYDEAQRGEPGGFDRRARHHGHLGDLVADPAARGRLGARPRALVDLVVPVSTCARRGRTSSARGCSRRCCAARSSTASRRGRTPRSRASSSTPTARRCRSRRATSSRPPTSSSSTAPTRCATGRHPAGSAPMPRSTRRTRRRSRSAAASRSRC